MKAMLGFCLCFALVVAALAVPQNVRAPPTFSDAYVAVGVMYLPYAEIEEPIQAWYDGPGLRSRVDYYDGMVKTFQRADVSTVGLSLKVAPMTNEEVTNSITCFAVNGSTDYPVTIQSILPDLSTFSYSNDEAYNNVPCSKWVLLDNQNGKLNKYSFWISTEEPAVPVHYEMKGYDTLLGSHYDKYTIDYTSYEAIVPDPSVFDVPDGLVCGSFPGPGVEHVHIHNPVKEFVDNEVSHIHFLFDYFKEQHSKSYASEHENEMRKNIFRHNFRYIHSTNRKGLKYQLKVNHLTDATDEELWMRKGRIPSKEYNGGLPFDESQNLKAIEESVDWRLYGAVTSVKDQAVCGSCWSFGTIGTLEGSYFLKTGQLLRFSEQALIDCTWGYGNNGCDGGEDFRAFQWIMKHGGVSSFDEYGLYLGEDGYCHAENTTKYAQMTGYVNITEGDIDALKLAITNFGPISVSIDASLKDFSFYANGVFYNPDCKNGYDELDHSVLAVGYGIIDGEAYWLIKNSWSSYWGNDGYILMSQTDNNCGVATAATYANLA